MTSLNILHANEQRNIIRNWEQCFSHFEWAFSNPKHGPPSRSVVSRWWKVEVRVWCFSVSASQHMHIRVSARVCMCYWLMRVYMYSMSLSVLLLFLSLSLPFISVCKTEMSCYGDWDTWAKRKWQNREMRLSGDTLGPWGLKEGDWEVCPHRCVRVNSRFRFYQQLITFIFPLFIIKANSFLHTNQQPPQQTCAYPALRYPNLKTLAGRNAYVCWYTFVRHHTWWGCDPSSVDRGLSDWPVIIQPFRALHHLIITLHWYSIASTRPG